jgi:hypothetical protein
MHAFLEYFRCPDEKNTLVTQTPLSLREGYFRFGGAVAYGRVAGSTPATYATDQMTDVSTAATTRDGRAWLPFDLSAVATNLRQERYRQNGDNWLLRTHAGEAARRIYYAARPLMGVGLRKHLQKAHLNGWHRIAFPHWPVDLSVEKLMEASMTLALEASGAERLPFIWFWPDGASACGLMTHDIEGQAGLNFCDALMDLDDAHALKSAFQLIPEGHEDTWQRTAERMRRRGFEVNLHDLNHDGRLFADRDEFLARARRINGYARRFDCEGFRSGAMYREQDWFGAFEFAYDMSVPNAAHLEPQRGGCCTVMPYFVGDVLELPLTTTQDYSLFHILNDYSIDLWHEQISLITGRHGLISLITHPDYLDGPRERHVYRTLLRHLAEVREREGVWFALPGQVNRWWRNRRKMRLVREGDGWRIDGPDAERARVAYASLQNGRLVYDVEAGVAGTVRRHYVPVQ